MNPVTRKLSEFDIYHVVSRGVGHQIIFEDDSDRRFYCKLLKDYVYEHDGDIMAWCLMDNHLHLLLKMRIENISLAMQQTNSVYAAYFNERYGRCGHLFQSRFKSEPVNDEGYLLTVVRYIHQNPEKAGISSIQDYPWSSYRGYLAGKGSKSHEFVLDLLGGVSEFKKFHSFASYDDACIDVDRGKKRLDDSSALLAAKDVLSPVNIESVSSLPKERRNDAIRKLSNANLSVRQIERFTGVSKSIVARVSKMGQ